MKKIDVVVCSGTACFVMGGSDFLALGDYLPPELAERVSLSASPCLNTCKNGMGKPPYVTVNGELMAAASLSSVIDRVRALAMED